jgi:uncharacterized membrane protein
MDDSALNRAKQPRTVLAGPYGHPFHPILVTIPIGTWVAAFIFDLVAIFSEDDEVFARGAMWLVGIGIIGALLAAIFGFIDYGGIAHGTKARRTATIHMGINLTVTALFVVSFFVRWGDGFDDVSVLGFVLLLLGLAWLGVSGYLGGHLAYRYGIRVADENTQREGFH